MQLLEDLLKLKYNNEISDDWNLTKVKNKEEMIITNTYVNTRIAPSEESKQGEVDANTYRNKKEYTDGMS